MPPLGTSSDIDDGIDFIYDIRIGIHVRCAFICMLVCMRHSSRSAPRLALHGVCQGLPNTISVDPRLEIEPRDDEVAWVMGDGSQPLRGWEELVTFVKETTSVQWG